MCSQPFHLKLIIHIASSSIMNIHTYTYMIHTTESRTKILWLPVTFRHQRKMLEIWASLPSPSPMCTHPHPHTHTHTHTPTPTHPHTHSSSYRHVYTTTLNRPGGDNPCKTTSIIHRKFKKNKYEIQGGQVMLPHRGNPISSSSQICTGWASVLVTLQEFKYSSICWLLIAARPHST